MRSLSSLACLVSAEVSESEVFHAWDKSPAGREAIAESLLLMKDSACGSGTKLAVKVVSLTTLDKMKNRNSFSDLKPSDVDQQHFSVIHLK